MNWRLEERDRFTALGERSFKRITDKVIEEVLAAAMEKKEVAQTTNTTPNEKLVIVYLQMVRFMRC